MDLRTIAPQVAQHLPPGSLVEMRMIQPPPPHEDGYCTGCGGPTVRPPVCPHPPCRVTCPYCSPCQCAMKAEFGGMEEPEFDDDEEEWDYDDDDDDDDLDEDDEDDEDDEEEDDEDDSWEDEEEDDEDDEEEDDDYEEDDEDDLD